MPSSVLVQVYPTENGMPGCSFSTIPTYPFSLMQPLPILSSLIGILYCLQTSAQDQVLENWTNQSEEVLYEEDIAYLSELKKQPIDLNNCSLGELQRIPGINMLFAHEIIRYRDLFGEYQSVYELQVLDHVDIEWLIMNSALFTCHPSIRKDFEKLHHAKQHILFRWKPDLFPRQGYQDTGNKAFAGGPHAFYLRYRGTLGQHLQIGASLEKDAGEANYSDHIGGFVRYHNKKRKVRELIVGDYQMQLGQGLLISSVRQVFAGELSDGLRVWNGIQPVASTNEQFYQRGIAMSLGSDENILTMGLSSRNLDARVYDDSNFTIYSSGLHRTTNERQARRQLHENHIFIRYGRNFRNLKLGMNLHYLKQQLKDSDKGISIDFHYVKRSSYFYGELAIRENSIKGLIGHVWSLDTKNDIHFQGRIEGAHLGQPEYMLATIRFSHKAVRRSKFNTFFQVEKEDRPQFRNTAPGFKKQLSCIYFIPRGFLFPIELRIKAEESERNQNANSEILRKGVLIRSVKLRMQLSLIETETIRLNWRSEVSRVKANKLEKGALHYLDLAIKQNDWSIGMRYSHFSVSDFDARIYVYERDVLYSYSIPSFQNSGQRLYFLANTKWRKVKFSLKYGVTGYSNPVESGSGADYYLSKVKHDFKVQISTSW